MRTLIASAFFASTLLSGCGGSSSIRSNVEHLASQMQKAPSRVQTYKASLATHGVVGMVLHLTDGDTVIVSKAPEGARFVSFEVQGNWIDLNDGKCELVEFKTAGCVALSAEEWKEASNKAIAYANRNGGHF
jgi:outer membrane lipoprotein-sorting protein